MRRAALVLCLLTTAAVADTAPAPRRWSPEELIALDGIGGFGSVGRIDTAPDKRAPGNTLGFSLRFDWAKHGAEPPYWSIRCALPRGSRLADYDTFACDLLVEGPATANLGLYLYEPSDNRWVIHGKSLASYPPGAWQHIEVRRTGMSLWKLSRNPEDWTAICGLAIEPNNGVGVFYLDNLVLKGPGGKVMPIIDTGDDGLVADPAWHEPVAPLAPAGTVYFPHDASRLEDATLRASAVELQKRFGPIGVPLSGFGPGLVGVSRQLRAAGIQTLHYASFGGAYRKFLTRRGGWDENLAGRSLNWLPGSLTDWDWQHMLAFAHPAVTEAQERRIDALLQAGISTWLVVDYTFPWQEGPWGYSDAMQNAFRDDLLGRSDGLHVRGQGGEERLPFAGYCQAYLGFEPRPEQFGLARWEDWSAPRPADPDQWRRPRQQLFMLLRSFEWLKLPDRVGRYYRDHGGQPLWIIPNPEDTGGSSDYQFMLRTAGVGNLFPEWFGPIGWAAEATYASLPGLREVADRSGTRLSIIHETGAGGHAAPYLDWRVAYSGVYAIAASGKLDDFDNDFLDEGPVSVLDQPGKDAYQFRRFREGLSKALAFRQARADGATRPPASILCIGERPPARACGSPYFGLNQPHGLSVGLSRAHLLFDLRDSLDLRPEVLDRYPMVAYGAWAPRPGDVAMLRAWLEAKPGRVLVMHSFQPTRDSTEFWGLTATTALGAKDGATTLGLGRIEAGAAGRVTITGGPAGWPAAGRQVDLPSPLCRASLAEPVMTTLGAPLVSRAAIGGSRLYYLGYTPGDGDGVQRLDADVLTAIAAQAGQSALLEADFDTLVQRWTVPGGQVICAWDAPTLGRWSWRYEPGIAPLAYAAPGVARTIRLPLTGRHVVYDLWADAARSVEGAVTLKLEGALCGLWYVVAGEGDLAGVRGVRARMAGWQVVG
jgi:hypothetical protein